MLGSQAEYRVVSFPVCRKKLTFARRENKLPSMFGSDTILTALQTLGEVLKSRDLRYSVAVIGGSNLIVLGRISRASTQDVDVVAEVDSDRAIVPIHSLALPLEEAVRDVAISLGLPLEWFNSKASDLGRVGLPSGFSSRMSSRDFGTLQVWFAGRSDMIALKLYAAADSEPLDSRHHSDLREMQVSAEELRLAEAWAREQDPTDAFAYLVRSAVAKVAP